MRTIGAIASGIGGGIGVVRISGPEAEEIGRGVLSPWPEEVQSHHLYLGHVHAKSPELASATPIDQVLFCLMRAPRSYTGEDVLEIQGHGGQVNLRRLLDACLAAGAQPAGPGEFTRRAFLSGKLDLTQAEAVAELIGAQSVEAARQAQRQLHGELHARVSELRRGVISLVGEFEGMLDFPDVEADGAIVAQAQPQLRSLAQRMSLLAASFLAGGKALHDGIEIAVLGRTNVGKSSLVNALCQAERVLVDSQAGTTRDYVEVRSEWQGVSITLIDTAGERADATALEAQGLRLGRERWRRADLLLLVVDGTVGLGPEETQLLGQRPESLPVLVVWNKVDRVGCQQAPGDAVACSALCGWGLAELRQAILSRMAPAMDRGEALLVTSARQAGLLEAAAAALMRADEALSAGDPTCYAAQPEIIAGELRVAAARLAELTGDEVSERVLDAIFSRFCIGK